MNKNNLHVFDFRFSDITVGYHGSPPKCHKIKNKIKLYWASEGTSDLTRKSQ